MINYNVSKLFFVIIVTFFTICWYRWFKTQCSDQG